MKNYLIIANWKLNNNKQMIKTFFQELNTKNIIHNINKCRIVIAPSTIYLYLVKKYIINYPNFTLASQDVDIHLSGGFTGETSAEMLKETGVQYVIIGHSERRKYHKETNKDIAKKFHILKKTKLTPILCIGENKIEKETGQTKSVCKKQLNSILELLSVDAFKNTIIAYEPTWSIGTGTLDTPEKIQEIHYFIRKYIAKHDQSIANQIYIQYGGSVNQSNIKELLKQPDIDGVLVGTSSLQASTFTSIIQIAENIT